MAQVGIKTLSLYHRRSQKYTYKDTPAFLYIQISPQVKYCYSKYPNIPEKFSYFYNDEKIYQYTDSWWRNVGQRWISLNNNEIRAKDVINGITRLDSANWIRLMFDYNPQWITNLIPIIQTHTILSDPKYSGLL